MHPEEASAEKRVHLADRVLQAALHAQDLAPLSGHAQYYVALGYYATCNADRVRIEAEKAAALNPYNAGMLGGLSLYVAFTGHWDEGKALAEKAMKLAGPTAVPVWWWPAAKQAWFRGEYQVAYEAFQRAYIESFWLSHLDLARMRSSFVPSAVAGDVSHQTRPRERLLFACAVRRRRFPVGASPTRRTLQPEATGAVMEVTKWLKPSV